MPRTENKNRISRRAALVGATSLSATALAGASSAPRAARAELDLADPKSRARIRAKVSGSIATETVYTFCKLHLYLWLNDGNLLPMVTMSNLNVATWSPLASGNYLGKVHEVGVYTKFDSDDLIETWTNPVTGESREVWQFIGGPLSVEIGPDGIVTGADATLKPKPMQIEQLGDMVLVPSQSAFSFPNPFSPAQWPKEAGGPKFYWDSHYVFGAKLADVLNPRTTSCPSFVQFQNLVSFHPWIGMGQKPGRTYGKAYGAKIKSIDQLPRIVRSNLEKKTPEIFDIKSWTKPRLDFVEYMQQRKPS
jgi:hypothetical protein